MKKLKVLHILNSNSYSGAENVVISIIEHTADEAESVYLSPEGNIRNILNKRKIAYFPVPCLSVKNLRKAIKQIKPDIIHAHDFTAGIIVSASTFKIPIINHLHNNSPWIKKLSVKTIVYALSCIRYKKILTVSSAVMNEFILGKLFKKKCEVIGNPIDIQEILKKGVSDRVNEHPDIVFLGRLAHPKNPIFFVQVIDKVKEKIPDIKVAMIGDGELREQVSSEIVTLGLGDNIKLYGFLSNPYPYLANCKLLCMTSLWEGFGLAAVEALTFSKPVIASFAGGLPDLLNSSCGSFCNTQDEFAENIVKYLTDDKLYAQKSEGAKLRAEQLHNIEQYMNNIRRIYVFQSKKGN